jgi:hypothetical protein
MGLLSVTFLLAREPIPEIARGDPAATKAEFERLHALIKPQPEESPWREIPWLTSIHEARAKGAAEDKPLVVFTAADGSPLGRT